MRPLKSSGMDEIKSKLEGEADAILNGEILLVESRPELIEEVVLDSTSILTEKATTGIVITSNRPYSKLIKMCKEREIQVKNLFFIDAITLSVGLPRCDEREGGSVTFVSSASAISEISFALDKQISKINEGGFMLMDSMTTFLIHNSPTTLVRFIHYALTRLRVQDTGALLTTLNNSMDAKARSEIVALCDKTITL